MEAVTIRRKGQITLPAELRKELELQEGDIIYFERRGNETLLVRAEDIIARTAGALAKYVTDGPVTWDRDEIWGEMAKERDDRIHHQVAEDTDPYDSH